MSSSHDADIKETAIRNAKIVVGSQLVEAEILVRGHKIARVAKQVNAERTLDAEGQIVLPGAVDVHVHFRDLAESYKEDWYTGSCAAVAGGVTTVIDQPNTKPPVLDKKSLADKQAVARKSIVDYGINAAIDKLDKLELLWNLGVTAFGEIFLQQTSHVDLLQALQTIKRIGAIACVHAEQNIDGVPNEVQGVRAVLNINQAIGAKVHISHLSTAAGLYLLGLYAQDITCEVTPHHLFLSEGDRARLGPFAVMDPPLRSQKDVRGLWTNLNYVDMVASDHAPHSIADKKKPSPPPGVPGVQTLLPLLLSRVDRIGLGRLIELACFRPAARFNLEGKGAVAEGFDADLTFVNLKDRKIITPSILQGKSGWTPFEGLEAIFPSLTMVRGKIVYRDGLIMAKEGWGTQLFGSGKAD
ncbi:MAG: dihydroorotase [Euryarchaeota archaeon]|nr:dihydroorotase [Euryarchaeota archaeon]